MAKAITTKTESFTLRVPTDLMAELRHTADARGTPVAFVVLERLVRDPTPEATISPRVASQVFMGIKPTDTDTIRETIARTIGLTPPYYATADTVIKRLNESGYDIVRKGAVTRG